jgi:AbrB family looped-hinge helix DNA binding protein
MNTPTTATIDAAGRLVVPKPIRELAHLEPGMLLEVRFRDGLIEIEPAPRTVRLERRGSVLVAVPVGSTTPLTSEQVEASMKQIRHRGE